MSIILNVFIGAGLSAINAGIIYLSKKQPLQFDSLKFTRTVGVATLLALTIGFIPDITIETIGVVAVYGGFLIEKFFLLAKRRLEEGIVKIKIVE